jgi:hypothetical protein
MLRSSHSPGRSDTSIDRERRAHFASGLMLYLEDLAEIADCQVCYTSATSVWAYWPGPGHPSHHDDDESFDAVGT